MSYIGTTPPQTFSTATSQSFSGNGSTTVFTLVVLVPILTFLKIIRLTQGLL